MTTFNRAVAKVSRWIERQLGEFTKQQSWQSIKGGTIKTSADLETILGVLVNNGTIELLPPEGRRRPTYRVHRVDDSEPEVTVAIPPTPTVPHVVEVVEPPSEPITVNGDSAEPRSTQYPATVPAVVSTPEPAVVHAPVVTAPRMTDAEVLIVAAMRRARDGRIDHALELIESRHDWHRIGDTFQAAELNRWDQTDLDDIRKWIGLDPKFEERFDLVSRRVKQLSPGSPKSVAVAAITSAVRSRNQIPKGTGLTSGYFHVQEIARLEAILDGPE